MNIRRLIPEPLKVPLRRVRLYARIGTVPVLPGARYCPVCRRYSRRFEKIKWDDTVCGFCGSCQRHRAFWQFLYRSTTLGPGDTVLHFAPERQIERNLRKILGQGYISADLLRGGVDRHIDITDIPFQDDSFDVVLCSHVLEHIPDDRRAMREIARVLRPSGFAAILVPYYPEIGLTDEDPSIVDPDERAHRFGQEDHVRIYGIDFMSRLMDAGFEVQQLSPSRFMSAAEIEQSDITALSGDVFFCTLTGKGQDRLTVPAAALSDRSDRSSFAPAH